MLFCDTVGGQLVWPCRLSKSRSNDLARAANDRFLPLVSNAALPRSHQPTGRQLLKEVRFQFHLTKRDWHRSHFSLSRKPPKTNVLQAIHQVRAVIRSGEYRHLENPSGRRDTKAVFSLFCITPENNVKIRPQRDRENAFARASGGAVSPVRTSLS